MCKGSVARLESRGAWNGSVIRDDTGEASQNQVVKDIVGHEGG